MDKATKARWEQIGRIEDATIRARAMAKAVEDGLDWYRTASKASRVDGVVVQAGELVNDDGSISEVYHLIRHPVGSTWELFKAGHTVRWSTISAAIASIDRTWPLATRTESGREDG